MSFVIRDVHSLVVQYGWLLQDSEEARELVKKWGLNVEEELNMVNKAMKDLAELYVEKCEVLEW